MQIYGKMAVLLLFAKFAISPFYLAFIFKYLFFTNIKYLSLCFWVIYAKKSVVFANLG